MIALSFIARNRGYAIVEIVTPKPKLVPRGYLREVVGDTEREVETRRVEQVVTSSTVEDDLRKALLERSRLGRNPVNLPLSERSFDLILLSDWESQILYAPENKDCIMNGKDTSVVPSSHYTPNKKAEEVMTLANETLESGVWTQSIIWDSKTPFRDFTQLEIKEEPVTEPEVPSATGTAWLTHIQFVNESTITDNQRFLNKRARMPTGPRDKFNLSNDQAYEVSKEIARQRVRQTFQDLHIQHAYPAQKLQLPFVSSYISRMGTITLTYSLQYKTRLSKAEARSFHRPALQFPTNVEFRFNKVRNAKKKKDKQGRTIGRGGDVGEALRKTSDLTLKDTSSFILFEFSVCYFLTTNRYRFNFLLKEEHPPIISSFGMGSMVVNYYRKRDANDEHIPKVRYPTPSAIMIFIFFQMDIGEPFLIEPDDQSPFQKFGFVHKGQVVPALYNNLIRAPIFRHKPYQTDFLVVRLV